MEYSKRILHFVLALKSKVNFQVILGLGRDNVKISFAWFPVGWRTGWLHTTCLGSGSLVGLRALSKKLLPNFLQHKRHSSLSVISTW